MRKNFTIEREYEREIIDHEEFLRDEEERAQLEYEMEFEMECECGLDWEDEPEPTQHDPDEKCMVCGAYSHNTLYCRYHP